MHRSMWHCAQYPINTSQFHRNTIAQEMKDRESKRWLLEEFIKENEIRAVELEMAYKRFKNLAPSSGSGGKQSKSSAEMDFNTWILVSLSSGQGPTRVQRGPDVISRRVRYSLGGVKTDGAFLGTSTGKVWFCALRCLFGSHGLCTFCFCVSVCCFVLTRPFLISLQPAGLQCGGHGAVSEAVQAVRAHGNRRRRRYRDALSESRYSRGKPTFVPTTGESRPANNPGTRLTDLGFTMRCTDTHARKKGPSE